MKPRTEHAWDDEKCLKKFQSKEGKA